MDIPKMLEMQKQLDEYILEKHNCKGANIYPSKLLALYAELGELANETRCFKYWSNKGPSAKEYILEEYVDCLHFMLSIGTDLEIEDIKVCRVHSEGTFTDKFLDIFEQVNRFGSKPFKDNYETLFSHFLNFGYELGFEDDEIYAAYIKKNKINHRRQDEGY